MTLPSGMALSSFWLCVSTHGGDPVGVPIGALAPAPRRTHLDRSPRRSRRAPARVKSGAAASPERVLARPRSRHRCRAAACRRARGASHAASQDRQRQPGAQRAAAMAVGARGRDPPGRAGWRRSGRTARRHRASRSLCTASTGHAGQRRVDPRQAQRGRVDVHREHLGAGPGTGEQDRARPGAAADIDRAARRRRPAAPGAPRWRGRSGRCRGRRTPRPPPWSDRRSARTAGRPASKAGPGCASRPPCGASTPASRISANRPGGSTSGAERPAPAEHVAQVARPGVPRPGIDAGVGGGGGGGEAIASLLDGAGEVDERIVEGREGLAHVTPGTQGMGKGVAKVCGLVSLAYVGTSVVIREESRPYHEWRITGQ